MCNKEKIRNLRRINDSLWSKKKRILIVSFYFPATNSPVAVGVGKFATYLHEFDWEPIVLTADTSKDLPQTLAVEVD